MSSRVLRNALLSTAVAGLLSVPAAMAATATGGFQVLAEVQAQCEVDSSTTNMDFGVLSLTADNTATSTLAYRCTTGTTPDAALDWDVMTGAGGSLDYALFQDTSGTAWDTTSTQTLPAATGYNTADTVTVYGLVTAAQASADGVGVGSYVDNVTVTLTF